MFFNPIFVQTSGQTETIDLPKQFKLNNPTYLFSDIIKIVNDSSIQASQKNISSNNKLLSSVQNDLQNLIEDLTAKQKTGKTLSGNKNAETNVSPLTVNLSNASQIIENVLNLVLSAPEQLQEPLPLSSAPVLSEDAVANSSTKTASGRTAKTGKNNTAISLDKKDVPTKLKDLAGKINELLKTSSPITLNINLQGSNFAVGLTPVIENSNPVTDSRSLVQQKISSADKVKKVVSYQDYNSQIILSGTITKLKNISNYGVETAQESPVNTLDEINLTNLNKPQPGINVQTDSAAPMNQTSANVYDNSVSKIKNDNKVAAASLKLDANQTDQLKLETMQPGQVNLDKAKNKIDLSKLKIDCSQNTIAADSIIKSGKNIDNYPGLSKNQGIKPKESTQDILPDSKGDLPNADLQSNSEIKNEEVLLNPPSQKISNEPVVSTTNPQPNKITQRQFAEKAFVKESVTSTGSPEIKVPNATNEIKITTQDNLNKPLSSNGEILQVQIPQVEKSSKPIVLTAKTQPDKITQQQFEEKIFVKESVTSTGSPEIKVPNATNEIKITTQDNLNKPLSSNGEILQVQTPQVEKSSEPVVSTAKTQPDKITQQQFAEKVFVKETATSTGSPEIKVPNATNEIKITTQDNLNKPLSNNGEILPALTSQVEKSLFQPDSTSVKNLTDENEFPKSFQINLNKPIAGSVTTEQNPPSKILVSVSKIDTPSETNTVQPIASLYSKAPDGDWTEISLRNYDSQTRLANKNSAYNISVKQPQTFSPSEFDPLKSFMQKTEAARTNKLTVDVQSKKASSNDVLSSPSSTNKNLSNQSEPQIFVDKNTTAGNSGYFKDINVTSNNNSKTENPHIQKIIVNQDQANNKDTNSGLHVDDKPDAASQTPIDTVSTAAVNNKQPLPDESILPQPVIASTNQAASNTIDNSALNEVSISQSKNVSDIKIDSPDKQKFKQGEEQSASNQTANKKDFIDYKNVSNQNFVNDLASANKKEAIPQTFLPADDKLQMVKPENLVSEINHIIQQGDTKSAVLKLDPETLGKVKIVLDVVNKTVHANIQVENENAKQIVQNNLNDLKQSLNLNGLQLSSVNVSLSSNDDKTNKPFLQKKKSSYSQYGRKIEDTDNAMTSKSMGYNTYDYLI